MNKNKYNVYPRKHCKGVDSKDLPLKSCILLRLSGSWQSSQQYVHHELILKSLSEIRFEEFVAAIWKPPITYEVVPKTACDPKHFSESRLWHNARSLQKKSAQWKRRKAWQLKKKDVEFLSVFEETKRNFKKYTCIFFTVTWPPKKLRNYLCTCWKSWF